METALLIQAASNIAGSMAATQYGKFGGMEASRITEVASICREDCTGDRGGNSQEPVGPRGAAWSAKILATLELPQHIALDSGY